MKFLIFAAEQNEVLLDREITLKSILISLIYCILHCSQLIILIISNVFLLNYQYNYYNQHELVKL